MLEENALLVRAPATATNGKPSDRPTANILQWPSHRVLGFAAWSCDRPNAWWRSKRWSVDVYENEDASHLMTIHPPRLFFRGWEVRDAINRRVGVVYRSSLLDVTGDFVARVHPIPDNGDGRFVDWEKREVGAFESEGTQQTLLRFGDVLNGLPFARMLLLAAVLVRQSV